MSRSVFHASDRELSTIDSQRKTTAVCGIRVEPSKILNTHVTCVGCRAILIERAKEVIRTHGTPETCKRGEHIPVVLHRTGGPSASEKNTCGRCGRMIHRPNGLWEVDTEREAKQPSSSVQV